MMKNPYEELAKMFKENENRNYLGAMLAEVIEPLPNLKLKLLNGSMELDREIDGDNIFIARTITNRLDIDITFKDFESKSNTFENGTSSNNQYKNLTADGGAVTHPAPVPDLVGKSPNGQVPPVISSAQFSSGNIQEIKTSKHKNEKENKEKGKYKAQFLISLKKGEKVLVIPDESETQFFIVDVFDNLKEVSLEWEYYQKS